MTLYSKDIDFSGLIPINWQMSSHQQNLFLCVQFRPGAQNIEKEREKQFWENMRSFLQHGLRAPNTQFKFCCSGKLKITLLIIRKMPISLFHNFTKYRAHQIFCNDGFLPQNIKHGHQKRHEICFCSQSSWSLKRNTRSKTRNSYLKPSWLWFRRDFIKFMRQPKPSKSQVCC